MKSFIIESITLSNYRKFENSTVLMLGQILCQWMKLTKKTGSVDEKQLAGCLGLKECIGEDVDYDKFTGMGLRNRND